MEAVYGASCLAHGNSDVLQSTAAVQDIRMSLCTDGKMADIARMHCRSGVLSGLEWWLPTSTKVQGSLNVDQCLTRSPKALKQMWAYSAKSATESSLNQPPYLSCNACK